MTDNLWIDILICVLCSTLGGVIVATLSEFNPYAPSKVRRAVLVTFWLVSLFVASIVIGLYYWGGNGIMAAIVVDAALFVLFYSVIDANKENRNEHKEKEQIE